MCNVQLVMEFNLMDCFRSGCLLIADGMKGIAAVSLNITPTFVGLLKQSRSGGNVGGRLSEDVFFSELTGPNGFIDGLKQTSPFTAGTALCKSGLTPGNN